MRETSTGRRPGEAAARPRLGLQVKLPEGVTLAEWALERTTWQNPRIRVLLANIHSLEEVRESNYAILHCSPRRLQEIWEQVSGVATALRSEIAPLFGGASRIPRLEAARQAAEFGLAMLDRTLLCQLDEFPAEVPAKRQDDLRKLLCVAIGKMLDFLQDAFGHLMAADPRSQHDADYFLSRTFSRDVDDAEWLLETVRRLEEQVVGLDRRRVASLRDPARGLLTGRRVPDEDAWRGVEGFFGDLLTSLVPELKRVRGLKGIRLDELDLLSGYAADIPELCRTVREVRAAALATLSRLADGNGGGAGSEALHEVFAERMGRLMGELDDLLCDLAAFVPIWRRNVEQRRALLLREHNGGGE